MIRQMISRLWQYLSERPGRGQFHGGRELPAHKTLSTRYPSRPALLVPRYYLDLFGKNGDEHILQVAVGDYVLKGQLLTRPAARGDVCQHAPTSGVITAITPYPSLSGGTRPHLEITADGLDKSAAPPPPLDFSSPREEQLERIEWAGIAGLGGAGFPTVRKLRSAARVLVVNMAECEPYITCDDLQIQKCAAEILDGARLAANLVGAEAIALAIEDDKPRASAALRQALDRLNDKRLSLHTVPARYPSGNSRQLLELLFNVRIGASEHASDYGYLCHNSGTLKAVHDALRLGLPLIERFVTVSGENVISPAVLRGRIGTPVDALLQQCGGLKGASRLIVGGPMMGFSLEDHRAPLAKTTNALLAFPQISEAEEEACIRCGQCASACPMELLPQQLYWYSRSGEADRLRQYKLQDCIECGLCAAVCPSHIPLVAYYQRSKEQLRQEDEKQRLANLARQRHEARTARLERERLEREEKMRARQQKVMGSTALNREPSGQESEPLGRESEPLGQKSEPSGQKSAPQTTAPLGPPQRVAAFNPTVAHGDKSEAIAAAAARAAARRAERLAREADSNNSAGKNAAAEARRAERKANAAAGVIKEAEGASDPLAAAKAKAAQRRAARTVRNGENDAAPAPEAKADPQTAASHQTAAATENKNDPLAAAKAKAAARRAARQNKDLKP